jgi:predicted nuclease with TOPRIM domain
MPEHFVPKARYNEVAEAKKKLETDVTERDKQLDELKKAAGSSEELRAQIQRLQDENRQAKEKYETDLKELKLSTAIKAAIAGKVHDEELVAGLFDKTKLVLDGDKVVGLDEQLKTLQESKAFLFKQDPQPQPGFHIGGGSGQPPTNINQDQLAAIFGNTPQK